MFNKKINNNKIIQFNDIKYKYKLIIKGNNLIINNYNISRIEDLLKNNNDNIERFIINRGRAFK